MIDVKQAVKIAKDGAADMLDVNCALSHVEEIERDSYKNREVWSITLSIPGSDKHPLVMIAEPLHYKRFFIDVETGELLAIKMREFASR